MKSLTIPIPTIEKTVCIEAGHIYTNEEPALEHKLSALWGNILAQYLTAAGAQVQQWLFIDDYNPKLEGEFETLDEKVYIELLQTWGFTPQKIVHESTLIEAANDLLAYLKKKGLTRIHGSGYIVLNKDAVRLYHPQTGHYGCCLLDAALYMQKLKQNDVCITVLSTDFKEQQKGTKYIFDKMGLHSVVYPFYFTGKKQYKKHKSVQVPMIFANEKETTPIPHILNLAKQIALITGHPEEVTYD